MAEHRDAALDQEGYSFGHGRTALQLHAGTAGLRHYPGRAAERLRRAFLVAAERQVHDHQGRGGAAHDGATMRDHHLERDRHRAGQAVDHHAQAVADQEQVAGRIQKARHRRGVGRQADQGFSTLALPESRYGHAARSGDVAHGATSAPRRVEAA